MGQHTPFVGSCFSRLVYDFSTSCNSASVLAVASSYRPINASTLSFDVPNRSVNLCRQLRAESSSPVRRHDSMRFSYVDQSSGVSAAFHNELRVYGLIVAGVLPRMPGACCDTWSAVSGDKCAGGCRRAELIVYTVKRNSIGSYECQSLYIGLRCCSSVGRRVAGCGSSPIRSSRVNHLA